MLDLGQAVVAAKVFLTDLYNRLGEPIDDLRLEEVERQGERWRVVVGFRRPSPPSEGLASALRALQRDSKQVMVEPDGRVEAVLNA